MLAAISVKLVVRTQFTPMAKINLAGLLPPTKDAQMLDRKLMMLYMRVVKVTSFLVTASTQLL